MGKLEWTLGEAARSVADEVESWDAGGKLRRLWDRDASLWTGADEGRWLGWLDVPDQELERLVEIEHFAAGVRAEGIQHAVVLGMGGSSLFPDLIASTFPPRPGHPRLHVLDSLMPAQIRRLEGSIDLASTLFFVSSKSGTTVEPNMLLAYFHERVSETLGSGHAGSRFVAITDPGSPLEKRALEEGFRHVFLGSPGVGGRYSALSRFGLVPAAVAGVDVDELVGRAAALRGGARPQSEETANPALGLGAALGLLGARRRDKVTILASPPLAGFGGWLEQLLAESTGKHGRGLVPVDGERPPRPEECGEDRVFVVLELREHRSEPLARALRALEEAGHPWIRLTLTDPLDIGAEAFRWELATAIAGAILGINPFDQPDVEAAKVAARAALASFERDGRLTEEPPVVEEEGLAAWLPSPYRERLKGRAPGLDGLLAAHLGNLQPRDYFAVNAFLDHSEENDRLLEAIRHTVRDGFRVATTLGYGPRFLHSTGQLHKGGPWTGLFLHLTAREPRELPIPGQRFGFGALAAAQAAGDYQVLGERGRRVLRIDLGGDVAGGLQQLAVRTERAVRERG